MTELQNPAQRLYDLLNTAKQQNGRNQFGEIWRAVLELKNSHQGELLIGIADVIQLIETTKSSIIQLEGINHSILLEKFGNIETVFKDLNLTRAWEDQQRYLDETTMYSLRMCSDALSRRIGYKEIPKEEIDKLRADVEKLLNNILKSDLNSELKSILIENLETIRRALIGFRINGIDGLRQALEKNIGSVYVNEKLREEIKKAEPDNELIQKFRNILGALAKLVTESMMSVALEAGIKNIFLGSGW